MPNWIEKAAAAGRTVVETFPSPMLGVGEADDGTSLVYGPQAEHGRVRKLLNGAGVKILGMSVHLVPATGGFIFAMIVETNDVAMLDKLIR
jgi:hypothetical protein